MTGKMMPKHATIIKSFNDSLMRIPDPLWVLASCSDKRAAWLLLLGFGVCKRACVHHLEVCMKVCFVQRVYKMAFLHLMAFVPHLQRGGDSKIRRHLKRILCTTIRPPEWVRFSVTLGFLVTEWHLLHLPHLKVFLFLEVCRMAFSQLHRPEVCRKACSELELCKRVCSDQVAYMKAFPHLHYFQRLTEPHFRQHRWLHDTENKYNQKNL